MMRYRKKMYDDWPNLAAMVFAIAEEKGNTPLFHHAGPDGKTLSWRDVADQSAALAAGLVRWGVRPADRVAILAPNSANWAIADIAIMALGGITVPIYTTHSARDCAAILSHSGARVVITATLGNRQHPLEELGAEREEELGGKIGDKRGERMGDKPGDKLGKRIGGMIGIIGMDHQVTAHLRRSSGLKSSMIHDWQEVCDKGRSDAAKIRQTAITIADHQSCCLIYTSGTTGEPRAAELSHRAILANCQGAFDLLEPLLDKRETFFSFLPLSHSYERMAGLYFPLSIRARIVYARGMETLADDLRQARPTLMTAVPRFYETLRGKMLARRRRMSPWRAKLFDQALSLAESRNRHRLDHSQRPWREKVADVLLEHIVRRKIRQGFGGRLKAMVSGGAALDPRIERFFHGLGLRILQGYGQTEAGPVISCNRFDRNRIGTVGVPLDGIEVRLSDQGEILVRSPSVMKGYWRDRQASAKILRQGWLYTGDMGRVDSDGFITILGRNREIIVTSGGDNVSSQKVESALLFTDAIHQAVVFGDGKPWLGCLIVVEQSFRRAVHKEHHDAPHDADALHDKGAIRHARTKVQGLANDQMPPNDRGLHKALATIIEDINGTLSSAERVRKFILTDDPFTIENGLLTPTFKPRRTKILEKFRVEIEGLYQR